MTFLKNLFKKKTPKFDGIYCDLNCPFLRKGDCKKYGDLCQYSDFYGRVTISHRSAGCMAEELRGEK